MTKLCTYNAQHNFEVKRASVFIQIRQANIGMTESSNLNSVVIGHWYI